MDSHLDGIYSFYLNSIFCNSFRNGVWNFFFSFSSFFLKKITPYSFAGISLRRFGMARTFWDEWAHCGDFGFVIAGELCLVKVVSRVGS